MTVHAHPAADRPGLDPVRELVLHTVRRATTGTDALVQLDLARQAFDEFVAHGLTPRPAARAVAVASRHLGEHHAHQQLGRHDVERYFSVVARAIQRDVLPHVVVRGLDDREIRARVREYLRQILCHVIAGLTTAHQLMRASPEARTTELLRTLVDGDLTSLPMVARVCGLDPVGQFRPIITRDQSRWGSALLGRAGVISAHASRLAIVTGPGSAHEAEALVDRPTAIGPLVQLDDLADAVRLTQLAAACDAAGHAHVERMLADLVVTSQALLSDLIIDAHLGALQELRPAVRHRVASTLLAWLQTGRSLADVARDLGQPRQTVHGRVQTARRLLGAKLDDPDQRLELTLALRLAVHQWQADA